MKDLKKHCKLALVQATPVLFDKEVGLKKSLDLMEEAAKEGADFIVFPELFIPGYPEGMNFGFSIGKRTEAGRKDWKAYYDHSLLFDGPEVEALKNKAMDLGVYLSFGYSERDGVSATLYNANLLISPQGEVKNHRKLKPTGSERLIWGDANKDYFPVMDTPWGPVGALICWESFMPLARCALYEKGVTIYLAPNTNSNEEWQHSIRHIAIEGHCFFVHAAPYFTKASYPETWSGEEDLAKLEDPIFPGGSCVIDPFGHPITETAWNKEVILYADLDMDQVPASRMEHDVIGHYARPDVLRLDFKDE